MKDDKMQFQCGDVRMCAAAWLDEQLSPAESEFLEEHLSQCHECEEFLSRLAAQDLHPPKLTLIQDDAYWREMDEVLASELLQAERAARKGFSWRSLLLYVAVLMLSLLWGVHHRQRSVALEQLVESQQRTLEHLERISAQPQSPKTYTVPAKYVPARMEL
jgi:predicted anti-sigma-YlaC factor YlaD